MVAAIRKLFNYPAVTAKASAQLADLIRRYQWLVLAAIISTLGFIPSTIITFKNLRAAHGIHAAFALAWLSVLALQLILLKRGWYKKHRYLGWISVPVFAGMVISAGYLLWLTAVPAFAQGAVFRMVYWVDFILLPVALIFYILGLFNIRNTVFHAGFMCMTSVVLIPPGLGRLVYALILYPLDLPLAWFYELMAVITLGLVATVGFAERWNLPASKWAFAALLIAFTSAYWAESQFWLNTLIEEYFYQSISSAHK